MKVLKRAESFVPCKAGLEPAGKALDTRGPALHVIKARGWSPDDRRLRISGAHEINPHAHPSHATGRRPKRRPAGRGDAVGHAGAMRAGGGLRNRVRANLRYLEKGGRVLKDGKGPGAVWRLA